MEDDPNHCWINYVHDSYEPLKLGIYTLFKKNQVLLGTFLNVFGGCLSCVIVRDGCGLKFSCSSINTYELSGKFYKKCNN